MRKLSPWLVIVSCGVVVAFVVIARLHRYPDPDPTIETKMRLRLVTQASCAFNAAYDSWPTGFSQLYPDQNRLGIAFVQSWATTDAWGHSLIYRPFDSRVGFGSVVSPGRDGRSDIEERFQ